jgi:hypothetical protein
MRIITSAAGFYVRMKLFYTIDGWGIGIVNVDGGIFVKNNKFTAKGMW